ncbi:MAG: endonuclease/exonuclease/phosphatase family protein [Paramuribaculum sp.]|nr:endonuclease/exonuclease/phosphatase family protein [Paramuribaculum sp.]
MIHNRIFASVLALAALFVSYAQSATFNVSTYNIRQLNSDDDKAGNGWSRRLPIVADLIKFHDFDIFGTQEGFKSQLDSLDKALPQHAYIGIGRDDGKEAGEHSAIFYRTDMFDLIDHGDFWLSETPDRPALGWDAVCIRICTWGRFRHRASGKEFLMFNLHMDHVGITARIESAKMIRDKILEFGSGLPAFLTGDFNVDQTSDAYRTVLECGLVDSHDTAALCYATNGTFNDYATEGYSAERIDHVFVSPEVEVLKYGILTDTYRTAEGTPAKLDAPYAPSEVTVRGYKARTPSDHFPVRVTVRL